MAKVKVDCCRCAHFRREKEYLQQPDCGLDLKKSAKCKKFVDVVEWKKYQEIMKERI